MEALISLLGYGLVVAAAGFVFAYRERKLRRTESARRMEEILSSLQHARLKTDAGEEIELYLAKPAR